MEAYTSVMSIIFRMTYKTNRNLKFKGTNNKFRKNMSNVEKVDAAYDV